MRYLIPVLFESVVNKAQQQHQQQQRQSRKPEGDIMVDYFPQGKKSTVPDTVGEFVDYEEVK
jgi:hypothetical protein